MRDRSVMFRNKSIYKTVCFFFFYLKSYCNTIFNFYEIFLSIFTKQIKQVLQKNKTTEIYLFICVVLYHEFEFVSNKKCIFLFQGSCKSLSILRTSGRFYGCYNHENLIISGLSITCSNFCIKLYIYIWSFKINITI